MPSCDNPSTNTTHYFERFGFCDRLIEVPPDPDLGLVLVIPCHREPDLIQTLDDLWQCIRPEDVVTEVIVVINSAADAPAPIQAANATTLKEARFWIGQHQDPQLVFHLLDQPDLPPRHAGVGLARKIGMDEALRRLEDVNRPEGIIGCLDADCRCEPNYLSELVHHFMAHPKTPGCAIRYAHPLEGPEDPKVYEAITAYELHLRYYVNAMRQAGSPFAHQTIGSAMAVRASAYLKQGGMNRRKAGEDFYFLNKIIPLGHFSELNSTCVIPSPRPSDRVPFGTGRAVTGILESGALVTYPRQAFLDLATLFQAIRDFDGREPPEQWLKELALPNPLAAFLEQAEFTGALDEMIRHTASPPALNKRFHRWFDPFRIMKFVHHARDTAYGMQPVEEAARQLFNLELPTAHDLLVYYRERDQEGETNH